MARVYSRNNARSDWLILGYYSPVMPTDRLRTCKKKAKIHMINNLITSNVRSTQENLKPGPCRIDLVIRRSVKKDNVSVLDFSVKTSLSVNKFFVMPS